MRVIAYFIFVNFLSSVSMGVFLIALPWLIVKISGGGALIATSVLANLLLFLLRNRSGALVDSVPRAKLFAIAMLVMAALLAMLALFPGSMALKLGVFFCGQIYLFFFYVIRSAITREIVPEGQYGRYNGILEIEGQVSTFVAGGVTAYFFGQDLAALSLAFWCGAAGMLISAMIVQQKLKTQGPIWTKSDDPKTVSQQKYPAALLFLSYCGSVPFICVMLLNVVKPIVIVDLLQYPIEVLALTSVFYTVGAIAAGLLGGRSWMETASKQVIALTLAGFLISCLLPAIIPSALVLYLSSVIWGFCNGLSRITWQTAAMNQIGDKKIGGFFASISAGVGAMRIGLLLGYWAVTALWGYHISFVYLALVCTVGLVVFSAKNLARP